MPVTVEVAHDDRHQRIARTELHGLTELAAARGRALERPHRDLSAHDGGEVGPRIADEVGDHETIAASGEPLERHAALDIELAGARLLEEHHGARLARVHDVHEAVGVEVIRHHRVHLVRYRHLDALEAPVRRHLVHSTGRLHGVVGRRVRLLQVQLDAALEVVGRDQVEAAVGVHVGVRDRTGARVDLDHLEPVEPEVGGDVGVLGADRTRTREERCGGGSENEAREREIELHEVLPGNP